MTIYFRAPKDAEIAVKVPKGEFSFHPMDLPETEGLFPLGATIEIHRGAVMEQATTPEYEDDFPSLIADGGRLWLTWVGYKNGADQLFLRSYLNGGWSDPSLVTDKPGDILMSAAGIVNGKPMVIWSAQDSRGFQLKARVPGGAVETLTADGNNLFHRVATDVRGNPHVAYMSFRGAHGDIYLKSYAGGRWQNEIKLSDTSRYARANDWNPAVVADHDLTVWVAWDSYAAGSYNINLRSVKNGQPGPLLKVTMEPPAGLPSEPGERQQIQALRGYTISAGGKTYKLYRGDMHRHTEIDLP